MSSIIGGVNGVRKESNSTRPDCICLDRDRMAAGQIRLYQMAPVDQAACENIQSARVCVCG